MSDTESAQDDGSGSPSVAQNTGGTEKYHLNCPCCAHDTEIADVLRISSGKETVQKNTIKSLKGNSEWDVPTVNLFCTLCEHVNNAHNQDLWIDCVPLNAFNNGATYCTAASPAEKARFKQATTVLIPLHTTIGGSPHFIHLQITPKEKRIVLVESVPSQSSKEDYDSAVQFAKKRFGLYPNYTLELIIDPLFPLAIGKDNTHTGACVCLTIVNASKGFFSPSFPHDIRKEVVKQVDDAKKWKGKHRRIISLDLIRLWGLMFLEDGSTYRHTHDDGDSKLLSDLNN
jgi:hypothetical protein